MRALPHGWKVVEAVARILPEFVEVNRRNHHRIADFLPGHAQKRQPGDDTDAFTPFAAIFRHLAMRECGPPIPPGIAAAGHCDFVAVIKKRRSARSHNQRLRQF